MATNILYFSVLCDLYDVSCLSIKIKNGRKRVRASETVYYIVLKVISFLNLSQHICLSQIEGKKMATNILYFSVLCDSYNVSYLSIRMKNGRRRVRVSVQTVYCIKSY